MSGTARSLAVGAVAVTVFATMASHISTGKAGNTGNAAIVEMGRQLAAARGWTGRQFDCLNSLWTRESGWDASAVNPQSGATGIPQLLPSEHAIPADWSSPRVQIGWGLDYISGRYGDPCAAWQHEQDDGWY